MSELPDAIHRYLKTIKKTQCNPEHMKIYVPTCYGRCLPTVHKLISELNRIFEGSTIYDATGTWLNPDTKELETEPIKVVEIASRCTNKTKAQQFGRAIMEYGTKAGQHSLGIDRQDFFIARSPEIVKAYVKEVKRGGRFG